MEEGWLRRAIEAKRDGGTIDPAVWRRIVADYVAGRIDDAPVAAVEGLEPLSEVDPERRRVGDAGLAVGERHLPPAIGAPPSV